jgi:hypothetical protein
MIGQTRAVKILSAGLILASMVGCGDGERASSRRAPAPKRTDGATADQRTTDDAWGAKQTNTDSTATKNPPIKAQTVANLNPQTLPVYTPRSVEGRDTDARVTISDAPAIIHTPSSTSVNTTLQQQTVARQVTPAPVSTPTPAQATTPTPATTQTATPAQGDDYYYYYPGEPAEYKTNPALGILATGGLDEQGRSYTDSKDDSIMAAAAERFNAMIKSDPLITQGSLELAGSINNVVLAISTSGNGQTRLNIDLRFSDRDQSLAFVGRVQSGFAELRPREVDQLSYKARVICADLANSCRNSVIVLDQFLDGKLCRRAYIVYRNMIEGIGDGHFTISKADFEGWQNLKEPTQRGLMRLMSNTVHYNLKLFKLSGGEGPLRSPRLAFIGMRSWAVVMGAAMFDIDFSKLIGERSRGSTTTLRGPLLQLTAGSSTPLIVEGHGYDADAEVSPTINERFLGNLRSSLIGNDGRGKLKLQFQFGYSSTSHVNFTSLKVDVKSKEQLETSLP